MDSIEIKNIGRFMAVLLAHETFDDYLLQNVEITAANVFRIDGRVQKAFYSREEYEQMGKPLYTQWGRIRPLCYEIIKGNHTPVRFQIVLRLAGEQVEQLILDSGLDYCLDDIGGCYLNIRYENGKLHCITGTSMNLITTNKDFEYEWDKKIKHELADFAE